MKAGAKHAEMEKKKKHVMKDHEKKKSVKAKKAHKNMQKGLIMTHVKIMKKAASKLKADAKKYHKEAAHAKSKVKKKHEKVEEREALSASKDLRKRARKAHEY